METNDKYLISLIHTIMYHVPVTENKKYLDHFLFYFYFYFAPSTQTFLKISRKTFYKKKLALSASLQTQGCSSVILLRPKMGVAPHKHDVISMPTQQRTNTKHISIESYHPVVSIMLRYLDQIKTFGENLCCRKVKIDKNFWGDLPYFALKCDNFPKGLRKKAECPNEAYFLAKKI